MRNFRSVSSTVLLFSAFVFIALEKGRKDEFFFFFES